MKEMAKLAIIRAMSWNISAINNNPFEYWTLFPDNNYENLMIKIQQLIETPEMDVEIQKIFPESMFLELVDELSEQKIEGLQALERYWRDDYCRRKAIHGFLKDKLIGTKRLASMPDRITNTINLIDGGVCHRPSAINAYRKGSLSSISGWWSQWKKFMFHDRLHIYSKPSADVGEGEDGKLVCSLIPPILRGKYPAISEEEQAISIPLQILCLAILDAIFIHMLNSVGQSSWEEIRLTLCDALIYDKFSRICGIIGNNYGDRDVMFIQEAAVVFEQELDKIESIRSNYATLVPKVLPGKRDQNSFILLNRGVFDCGTVLDVTEIVLGNVGGKWLAPGDLLVISVEEKGSGCRWLMASFHGDSEGLATQPTLLSLLEVAHSSFADHALLIGLDANTRSGTDCQFQQSVAGFAEFLAGQQLVSNWGPAPDPGAWTTCSSRTYMQTQLNKAVGYPDRFARAQRHLKDWILAGERHILKVADSARDNTGTRCFVEGTTLPTLDFPSDHAIVSAVFHLQQQQPSPQTRPVSIELRAPLAPRAQQGERTLYDYWGIGSRPLAPDLGMDTWRVTSRLSMDGWRVSHAQLVSEPEGSGDEGEVLALLHKHYVGMAMGKPWNKLDVVKAYYSRSSDRSIWILFSRCPLSMAFRHTWVQILVFTAVAAFLLQGLFFIAELSWWSLMQCHQLRFTALSLRNESAGPPKAPGIAGFGISRGGCCDTETVSKLVWDGPTVVASYPSPVRFGGWWFRTTNHETSHDASKFRLECLYGDEEDWHLVTTPSWIKVSVGVPLKRDVFQMIDFGAPIVWVMNNCVALPVFSISGFAACALGFLRRGREAAIVFSGGFLFMAIIQLIWALDIVIVHASQKVDDLDSYNVNYKFVWSSWFYAINSFFLFGSSFTEVYAVDYYFFGILATGVVATLANDDEFQLAGSIGYVLVTFWSFLPSTVLFGLIALRYRTSRWVLTSMIAADQAAYDDAWRLAKVQGEELAASTLLELSTDEVKANLPIGPVRQFRSTALLTDGTDRRASPGVFQQGQSNSLWLQPYHSGSLMQSLDQLMEQAKCLNIFLKQKCKDLALISNGLFLSENCAAEAVDRTYRKFDEGPSSSNNWVFSDVKPHKRALEKLLRSYDCDVSRLLDCARQRIVFDSITDLHACLNAVRMDKEIKIVRLKNSLTDKADTKNNGGFRHLVLNICLKNIETTLLGVDSHVSELQLVLKSFAERMTEETHNRYRVLRNCRDAPTLWKGLCSIVSSLGKLGDSCLKSGQHRFQENREELFRGGVVDLHALSLDIQDCQLGFPMMLSKSAEHARSPSSLGSPPCATNNDARGELLQDDRKKLLCQIFQESMTSSTRYAAFNQFGSFVEGSIVEIAARRTAVGSIWDTCYPVATLLCKPWIPIVLAVSLVCTLLSMAANASLIWRNSSVAGRSFRFTPLQLRNTSVTNFEGRVVSSLWLLRDGCGDRLRLLDFNRSFERGGRVKIEFAEPVEVNGWSLVAHEEFEKLDPVRFLLERAVQSSGDDEVWETIGASWGWWTWSGQVAWDASVVWDSVIERNTTHSFYLGVPSVWSAQRMTTLSLLVVMQFWLFAWRHRLNARFIAALFVSLIGVNNCLAGLIYVLVGQWKIAVVSFGYLALEASFSVMVIYCESFLGVWLGIAGVFYLAVTLVHNLALISCSECLVSPSGLGIPRNLGLLEGLGCLSMFASAIVMRRRSRRAICCAIQGDRSAYDSVWTELSSDAAQRSALADVRGACGELRALVEPRQRLGNIDDDVVEVPSSGCTTYCLAENAGYMELTMMQKLEQLFVQSAGLDIFLREKCKVWAMQAGGSFLTGEGSFERWENLVAQNWEARVLWAPLKGWDRAAEKLFRCYKLDPLRLLDCCRQRIYFDDAAGLARCLRLLRVDPDVRLARVSNRLDAGLDAAATGGYRDVRVNLLLHSGDTRRLGVHLAVCELQLALIPFARHLVRAHSSRTPPGSPRATAVAPLLSRPGWRGLLQVPCHNPGLGER